MRGSVRAQGLVVKSTHFFMLASGEACNREGLQLPCGDIPKPKPLTLKSLPKGPEPGGCLSKPQPQRSQDEGYFYAGPNFQDHKDWGLHWSPPVLGNYRILKDWQFTRIPRSIFIAHTVPLGQVGFRF